MKFLIFSLIVILTGCAPGPDIQVSTSQIQIAQAQTEPQFTVGTHKKEYLPHIWSDHKVLKISVNSCADKGKMIFESLGFTQIVRKKNFVYANYSKNRAIIKCVAVSDETFVYTAVAGANVKAVERLRNKIVWQL